MTDNREKAVAEQLPTLLPCPFCGGSPRLARDGGGDERDGYNFRVLIGCTKCGATLTAESHKDRAGWCNDTGQGDITATLAWNRRRVVEAPLSCGHHASLMLKSAETGEDLHCECCDAQSRARDAETVEAELRREVEALRADRDRLQDPAVVHVALLRGEIGKPDIRDLLHVYGESALEQFDRGALADERVKP